MKKPSFRTVAAVLTAGGLGVALWSQREAIASFDWSVNGGVLALSAAMLAVAPLLQAASFLLALRWLGAEPGLPHGLRVWGRSFLLRYSPTGALAFVHRVRERDSLGATSPQVLTATAYEQFAAVAAGAAACLGGFLAAGLKPPLVALGLVAGVALIAFLARPRVMGEWIRGRMHRRGIELEPLLTGRRIVALAAINLAGWTLTALGNYTLVRALTGGGHVDPWFLAGAFALAWTLGVLLPLLPGGAGAREGSLVVMLAAQLGTGVATAMALALRLVATAAELLAVAALELAALALLRTKGEPVRAPQLEPRRAHPSGRGVVVVPTYEEAEMLRAFVARFEPTGLDLLIVDDASPDGTGELAEGLARGRAWMHVLHRPGKEGLGVAYRAGFAWCLERGYDVIGQMDCDLSHPPERLAAMVDEVERGADLAIGSRYVEGGGTAGWSRAREAMSRVGCLASRLLLGLPYGDLSGGFKVWRASTLRELQLERTIAAGYAFQVETTQLAHLAGKRIVEVPFVFSERAAGESKMTAAISLEGIRVALELRRRDPRRRRRSALPAL